MKKTILSVLLLTIAILAVTATATLAASVTIPTGSNVTVLKGIGGSIIGLVQAAGIIVAVVMIIVVGIKYLTSSPEGKAQYKGTLMAYVVGAVLIFAATQIVGIVANFANSNISA